MLTTLAPHPEWTAFKRAHFNAPQSQCSGNHYLAAIATLLQEGGWAPMVPFASTEELLAAVRYEATANSNSFCFLFLAGQRQGEASVEAVWFEESLTSSAEFGFHERVSWSPMEQKYVFFHC